MRCQVADMRNLYESLDEVTVKDTLEGDNMYTCSQCGKKVRAEKRYFMHRLPTVRWSVQTHFHDLSFILPAEHALRSFLIFCASIP